MKDFFETIIYIFGCIVLIAVVVLIMPFLSFWFGYFGGWLCSLVIGDILVDGLNSLFNTTHFTKDMIPLCAATLGWIGGHFKGSKATASSSSSKKKVGYER